MRANYTRDSASIRTLILTLTKLNMLTYAEYFSCKARAAGNFARDIEKNCNDYFTRYEGFGHDLALAESLKKEGISIEVKGLSAFPVYRANRDRIVFYLNLTARTLLRKRKTKAQVKGFLEAFLSQLLTCQWTDGLNRIRLDRLLFEKLGIIVYDNGGRKNHEKEKQ